MNLLVFLSTRKNNPDRKKHTSLFCKHKQEALNLLDRFSQDSDLTGVRYIEYKRIKNPNSEIENLPLIHKYRVHYSTSKDFKCKAAYNFSTKNAALSFYNSVIEDKRKAIFYKLESLEPISSPTKEEKVNQNVPLS